MLKERWANVKAKATKKYQVVMYDSDSLSQSRNFSVKPLSFYLTIAGFSVLLIALTTILIFYIPAINQMIPGFEENAMMGEQFQELESKISMLEQEVEKSDTIITALPRILDNNPTAADREMFAAVTPEAEDNEGPSVTQDDMVDPADNPNPNNINVPTTLPSEAAPAQGPGPRTLPDYLNLFAPLEGIITNPFSLQDKPHYGIDIVADENAMIKSIANGVVIFSEYSKTTGHVLGIWHSQQNLVSFYKHNSKVFPQVGDYVFAGEAIAVIGNTGINSSGTHLHFELWYDNSPVNPTEYITF